MSNEIQEYSARDETSVNIEDTDCHQSALIEEEYINSMLNLDAQEIVTPIKTVPVFDITKAYRNENIECMIFNIAGMNLAIPELNIIDILEQQEISPVNNNATINSMRIGKLNSKDEDFDVIDLVSLIMNGIDSVDNESKYKNRQANIILLKGRPLGVAYDEVIGQETVARDQVRWRNEASDRVWLAGTVAQLGFSLLDVAGIISILSSKDLED